MEPDFYNLEILSSVACEVLERQRQEELQVQTEKRRQQEDAPQVKRQRQELSQRSKRSQTRRRQVLLQQSNRSQRQQVGPSSRAQLRPTPEWLLHFIQLNGGSQPVYLFSKWLTRSDVDKEQSRFLLNHQAVNRMVAQLNENEMRLVNQSKLELMVIDRQGRVHSMAYKKYASGAHRFISGWVELCESLGLKSCGDCVHVWSFRVDQVDAEDGEEDGEMRRSQFWLAIESTVRN